MPQLELGPNDSLRFEHRPPAAETGATFVGVNALTGDWSMWENTVADRLRAAGHGTLLWNFRGQAESRVPDDATLGAERVIEDLGALLGHCAPVRPVLVGLSIGGLFAARAVLAGASASGLVLINTLRRPGPRLAWINEAVARCAAVGGTDLVRDLYAPLLFDESWLAANRAGVLGESGSYAPLDPASGAFRLLRDCAGADWDVPWASLELPTLVVTGLQDRMFRVAEDVDRLAGMLPRATRVDLADAGHMVPVEQPARLAEELVAFAGRL